ncbi:UPF0489 family protein [Collimonas fungivorans]|uniref:UPF0489 family protein n=1 Tax=Collimonas fungivorans TaxID=158899 RepID=UPI003FA3856C
MNLPYEKITIGGKDVYIVNAHHFVLLPWADIRKKQATPPTLITLDHHTDTMPAFCCYRYKVAKGDPDAMEAMLPELITSIDWRDDRSLITAVGNLRYDEHIRAAVSSGILSRVFAINLTYETWTEHDGIYEVGAICAIGCDKAPHDNDCLDAHAAQVLESVYLDHELARANEMAQADGLSAAEAAPYILDIDLDYFHSERAINPDDPTTFYRLVRNAVAVTVALEPECVRELRCEGSNVTAEGLLEQLKQRIETAMT